MTNPAMEFSRLLLTAFFTVGPAVGVMLLLNARDRRQEALLETMWYLSPRDFRHLITIEVRCALLSGRSVAEVDMWGCGRDEIWDAIARWSAGLPPGFRLVVNGSMDRGLTAKFRIETVCRPAFCSPQHASAPAH